MQALCKRYVDPVRCLDSNFVLYLARLIIPWSVLRLVWIAIRLLVPNIHSTSSLTTSCLITGSHVPSLPRSLLPFFDLELLSIQQALNDITFLLIPYCLLRILRFL